MLAYSTVIHLFYFTLSTSFILLHGFVVCPTQVSKSLGNFGHIISVPYQTSKLKYSGECVVSLTSSVSSAGTSP